MKRKWESARQRWERKCKSRLVRSQADKWIAQVQKWAADHPRVPILDDSREQIYGDRS